MTHIWNGERTIFRIDEALESFVKLWGFVVEEIPAGRKLTE
jgi:hypothetical protein